MKSGEPKPTANAKKNDVKIMEGFMYVFHPQFDRIQNIINSSILGDINYAHSMFSFPIQPARFYRINRSIDNGGGALWDIGPYAIHTIRSCFKENPKRVYGQSKLNEHGADISTTGMIDFGLHKRAKEKLSAQRLMEQYGLAAQTAEAQAQLDRQRFMLEDQFYGGVVDDQATAALRRFSTAQTIQGLMR